MKHNWGIAIALLALLSAALACSSDSTGPTAAPFITSTPLITAVPNTTPIAEITGAPNVADTPVAQATIAPGKVGVRVESSGMGLTVNKVTATKNIQQFLTPKAGNVYVIVDVTIENIGQDTVPYNPLYFKVKDADGFEYDDALAAPDPSLKSGDLTKGNKARGNVAFEVPIGAKTLVVSYVPLVLFSGYETIYISIGDAPAAK